MHTNSLDESDVVPFKKPDLTCRECGGHRPRDRFAKPDICSRCYAGLKEATKYYEPLSNKAREILRPIFKKAILGLQYARFRSNKERFVNNFSPFSFSKFDPAQQDEVKELWMSIYDDLKGNDEHNNRDLKESLQSLTKN